MELLYCNSFTVPTNPPPPGRDPKKSLDFIFVFWHSAQAPVNVC